MSISELRSCVNLQGGGLGLSVIPYPIHPPSLIILWYLCGRRKVPLCGRRNRESGKLPLSYFLLFMHLSCFCILGVCKKLVLVKMKGRRPAACCHLSSYVTLSLHRSSLKPPTGMAVNYSGSFALAVRRMPDSVS